MADDWFVQKLQQDRAERNAYAQGVAMGRNSGGGGTAVAVNAKLAEQNTKLTADLRRTRDALTLEQRRTQWLKMDWAGAKEVIHELRRALVDVCSQSPDPAIRAKVEPGGVFDKEKVLDRWEDYAKHATAEQMEKSLPPNLR